MNSHTVRPARCKKHNDPTGQPWIPTSGYEVDLVGANAERLVLATVKSFFGRRGIVARDVAVASSFKTSGTAKVLKGLSPFIR
jgi:hypothetical protein